MEESQGCVQPMFHLIDPGRERGWERGEKDLRNVREKRGNGFERKDCSWWEVGEYVERIVGGGGGCRNWGWRKRGREERKVRGREERKRRKLHSFQQLSVTCSGSIPT